MLLSGTVGGWATKPKPMGSNAAAAGGAQTYRWHECHGFPSDVALRGDGQYTYAENDKTAVSVGGGGSPQPLAKAAAGEDERHQALRQMTASKIDCRRDRPLSHY